MAKCLSCGCRTVHDPHAMLCELCRARLAAGDDPPRDPTLDAFS